MLTNDTTPEYYSMAPGLDLFAWLGTLPLPSIPADRILAAWGLYVTAQRYSRRCLWKGETPQAKAEDARKAADCFWRLAAVLEGQAQGQWVAKPWETTTTDALAPQTIRYDQLSESNRDFVRRVHEPGSRWYYDMQEQSLHVERQHEWEHYERSIPVSLADGRVRRVELPEELMHGA